MQNSKQEELIMRNEDLDLDVQRPKPKYCGICLYLCSKYCEKHNKEVKIDYKCDDFKLKHFMVNP